MTLPRTTADVLARHVLFEIESIDRLYLNLYVPDLQRVGQVVGFLTRHLGFEIPSTAVIAPRSKAFVEAIDATPTTIGAADRFRQGATQGRRAARVPGPQ